MAVDHTADEHLVGREVCGQRAAHQVETDGLDGRSSKYRQRVVEAAVGRRHEDLWARGNCSEQVVGLLGRRQHVGTWHLDALAHEAGLFELHPLGAGREERGKQFGVDREQVIQSVERRVPLGRALARLAEQQECDRPDQHGTSAVPGCGRLGDLAHTAVGCEGERRLRTDLGHEVVVVGVEPLRHLGGNVVTLAACHCEVAGQVERAIRTDQGGETGWHRADSDRGVEHLVVVGERLGDRGIGLAEAEGGEPLAGGGAKAGRRRLEFVDRDLAGPERLDGLLQFATATDAGVAQDCSGRKCGRAHTCSLVGVDDTRPTAFKTSSTASCLLWV